MTRSRSHILRAIAIHGSQVKLAKEAGCSQQYISWLLKDGNRQVSAEMAIAFENATNGAVKKSDLRPDIFAERETAA